MEDLNMATMQEMRKAVYTKETLLDIMGSYLRQISRDNGENPKDAILKSFELAYQKDEPVLICGSFYLLAEVIALLQSL